MKSDAARFASELSDFSPRGVTVSYEFWESGNISRLPFPGDFFYTMPIPYTFASLCVLVSTQFRYRTYIFLPDITYLLTYAAESSS
jgi:hypothetical protein